MSARLTSSVVAAIAALAIFAPAPAAQNYPPPFPRDGAVRIAENERVAVWDLHWKKGVPTPMHQHTLDVVGVYLTDSLARTVDADGKTNTGSLHHKGEVIFQPRGIVHTEEATIDGTRIIAVELKDVAPPAALTNRPDLPPGFPRDGARRLIDNERVTVWDYTWTIGHPVPMHFHDKDTVVVFLEPGKIRSTDAEGKTTIATRAFGDVSVNARNRAHTEEAVEGSPRAIVFELK